MNKQKMGAKYFFSFKKHMVKDKYLYQFKQCVRGHCVKYQPGICLKCKAVESQGANKMAILMLSSAFHACPQLAASKLNPQGGISRTVKLFPELGKSVIYYYAFHTSILTIPVILQVAYVLALLLGSSMSLALTGRHGMAFKSVPDRFVAHPSHIVIYAPGDLLPCRL